MLSWSGLHRLHRLGECHVRKAQKSTERGLTINDSIIEAVSFFRKACIEYGADKSLDNAALVFEEQKNLFSAIQRVVKPAGETVPARRGAD